MKKLVSKSTFLPCLLTIIFFGSACGEDGTELPTEESIISKAGGEINLPGGIVLTIPEGAVTSNIPIVALPITDLKKQGITETPSFITTLDSGVVLKPHGTTFAKPITLEIPFEGNADELVIMRLDDEKDTSWEPIGPIIFKNGKVSVQIDKFSVYAVVEVAPSSCPCFNGSDVTTFTSELEKEMANTLFWHSGFYTLIYRKGMGNATMKAQPDYCQASVNASETEFKRYFPKLTPTTSGDRLTLIEKRLEAPAGEACRALLRKRTTPVKTKFETIATGLPEMGILRLSLNEETSIILSKNDETVTTLTELAIDTSYTVKISEQPMGTDCSLSTGELTGKMAETVSLKFTCKPALTPMEELCKTGSALNCPGSKPENCIVELEKARDGDAKNCQTEFDAWVTCVSETPESLICDAESPIGWTPIDPLPACQTQLEALQTCIQ